MIGGITDAARPSGADAPGPGRDDDVTLRDGAGGCPDDGVFEALLAGALDEARRRRLHAHLDRCADCRALLVALAPLGRAAPQVASAPTEPEGAPLQPARRHDPHFGHFTLLEPLGHGGMGTVWAAYDEALGRRVALKLVRPHEALAGDSHGVAPDREAARRLLREAQAMAALSHPGVVVVHEVGTRGDEVYVAMELVDGGTLAQWLAAQPRPWPAIVRMFVAAGRGLAAAHAAGMVHRDFKPANVLVRSDGRPCVTDFGLVHGRHGEAETVPTRAPADALDWSQTLTQTGVVMGTPRYMAPEQLAARPTGPRTDQFSFCVALSEALAQHHPFGDDVRTWLEGLRAGRVIEPRLPRQVPGRIVRALRRGLAFAPEQRFATMDALLAQLEAALTLRRRVATTVAGAAVVGLAALAGFTAARPGTRACAQQESFGQSWRDPARQARVREATFARAHADASWPRIVAHLDAQLDAGAQLLGQLCARLDAPPDPTAAADERALQCLRMHDQQLDAVVELLATDEAIEPLDVIYGLRPVHACTEVSALASVPLPPPQGDEAEVRALLRRVAAARARAWGGAAEVAITQLQAILVEAERLGYAPLLAEVHRTLGTALEVQDVDRALEHLRQAYALALRSGADVDVIAALINLAHELADRAGRQDEAQWLVDEADAWIERLGLREGPQTYVVRSTIARVRGDMPTAIALGARAVELAEAQDAGPAVRSTVHANLGAMQAESYRLADAREHLQRAWEIADAAYGPSHSRTLRARTNLVGLAFREGRYDEAVAAGRAVLAAYADAGIVALPEIAVTHTMLGLVARMQGRYDEAREHDEQALAIRRRVFGPEHRLVAESLEKLALDAVGDGSGSADERERAVELMRSAVALRERVHGRDHSATALATMELSKVLRGAGHLREAADAADAALAVLERAWPADEPRLYPPLLYGGMAALEVGERATARTRLQRAAALADADSQTPLDRAELALAQARATDDPAQALALAQQAQAALAQAPDDPAARAMHR
ncbi:MAG: tetratricopeptide repeat protein, partial [Nannocystaceae bacterium]|nr:tetratricopeptide repeat protein [Nannocystaceae bacterium]